MSLKLLSFVLSFQKRKYIKERGLQEIFVLMIPARLALQTPSVIFSRKCRLPLLGEACKGAPHRLHIPLLGEACKGASHRLHIPLLGEACKGASHRLHIPSSRRSLQGCSAPLAYPPKWEAKNSCAPPFPQAQKSRTNRNNPARSAPFFFRNVLRPEDFLISEKIF